MLRPTGVTHLFIYCSTFFLILYIYIYIYTYIYSVCTSIRLELNHTELFVIPLLNFFEICGYTPPHFQIVCDNLEGLHLATIEMEILLNIRATHEPLSMYSNIVNNVHHVLQYPFLHRLSYTTPCFFTHLLVLAPKCFGSHYRHLQGVSIQLLFIYKVPNIYAHLLADYLRM